MSDLKQHAKAKSDEFTRQVTSDPRWKLEDELMCQVFGFTLYGYVFGIGRVHCFMDVVDIHAIIVDQLAGLGIGRKWGKATGSGSGERPRRGKGHGEATGSDLNTRHFDLTPA